MNQCEFTQIRPEFTQMRPEFTRISVVLLKSNSKMLKVSLRSDLRNVISTIGRPNFLIISKIEICVLRAGYNENEKIRK